MSYNLLNESWIRVKYNSGEIKEIGIRKAFEDAEQIKGILPPVFRGDEISFYYSLIIRFLSHILMSAYYKENTGYASADRRYLKGLYENGIYSDILRDYLDKYEDRFDILSEEYPFLQNKLLKSIYDTGSSEDKKYLTWNPLAPGNNNKVFGKIRTIDPKAKSIIDQYKMSKEEFSYYLLYTASMGNTPATQVSFESSLGKREQLTVVIKGDNLAETILLNTYPLRNSSRPDEDYYKPDMPIWEMNDIHEVMEYKKDISSNLLCKAYYPGISILNMGFDEEGYLNGLVRVGVTEEDKKRIAKNKEKKEKNTDNKDKKEKEKREIMSMDDAVSSSLSVNGLGIPYDLKETISLTPAFNPAVILSYMEKGEESSLIMKDYKKDETASKLCICATKHTDKYDCCSLLNNISDLDYIENKEVIIFFRNMDGMKITHLELGYISGNNALTWQVLRNEDNHNLAMYYQEKYGKVVDVLRSCIKGIYPNANNASANAVKELSYWMEDDFFGQFTEDLSKGMDYESVKRGIEDRLSDKAISIYEKYLKNCKDYLTGIANEKKLKNSLNNIFNKQKKEKKDGRK